MNVSMILDLLACFQIKHTGAFAPGVRRREAARPSAVLRNLQDQVVARR